MNLAHVSEFRYSDSRHTRHTQITFWLLSLKFSTCSVYIYTHFYYYFKRRASFRALWLFQRFIYQFYFRVLSYLWILVILFHFSLFVIFCFLCSTCHFLYLGMSWRSKPVASYNWLACLSRIALPHHNPSVQLSNLNQRVNDAACVQMQFTFDCETGTRRRKPPAGL